MAWAWPKPESSGGATSTGWPPRTSPVRQPVGAWPSMTTVGGPPLVHVSKPVDGAAQRPAAPADRLGRRAPWRNSGRRPGAGSAAGRRRPSSRTRRQLAVRRRHRRAQRVRRSPPGCQLGRDGRLEAEPEAAVVQVDAGRRLDEPGAEAGGVRLDQAHRQPEASAVHRYVVSPGGRRTRPAPRRCRAARRGRRAARGPPPSAPSWSTSGRS